MQAGDLPSRIPDSKSEILESQKILKVLPSFRANFLVAITPIWNDFFIFGAIFLKDIRELLSLNMD